MTQKSHSYKGSYRIVTVPYEKSCACPVCKLVFKDDRDIESFFSHGACAECRDTYYYPNADKWNEGWRPDRAEKNT
tara:strand:+ start:1497 stop:1724 length:228 start_codon:yes stop_codon:yes gene_type:complete